MKKTKPSFRQKVSMPVRLKKNGMGWMGYLDPVTCICVGEEMVCSIDIVKVNVDANK